MESLLEPLLELLRRGGPLAYVLLMGAAAAEYLFPPLPGDTLVLTGVFLASGAGLDPWLTYASLNVGALVGGLSAYALGRRWADEGRRPRWLQGPSAERSLQRVTKAFERYGALYLLLNRFLPALRAFFFVGAGLARLPLGTVSWWGGISASLWNGVLFALGHWAGQRHAEVVRWLQHYGAFVLGGVFLWGLWRGGRWWAARHGPSDRGR